MRPRWEITASYPPRPPTLENVEAEMFHQTNGCVEMFRKSADADADTDTDADTVVATLCRTLLRSC